MMRASVPALAGTDEGLDYDWSASPPGQSEPFFPDTDPAALTACIATYQKLGCWTPHVEITRQTFEKPLDVFEYGKLIPERYSHDQVCVTPPGSDV